eukprot:NODE_67_length_25542_cov_1.476831.p1 type:complete len:920 gc:universal NODE_67_length_25542_cov_1.476831:16376-13617(-)
MEANLLPFTDTSIPKKRVAGSDEIILDSELHSHTDSISNLSSNSSTLENTAARKLKIANVVLSSDDNETQIIKRRKRGGEFKYIHPEDVARMKKIVRRPKEITKGVLKGFLPAVHVKVQESFIKEEKETIGKVAVVEDNHSFVRKPQKKLSFTSKDQNILIHGNQEERIIGNVPSAKKMTLDISLNIPNKRFHKTSFSFSSYGTKKSLSRMSLNLEDILELSIDATIGYEFKQKEKDKIFHRALVKTLLPKDCIVYGCYNLRDESRLYPERLLHFLKTDAESSEILEILSNLSPKVKINVCQVFGLPHRLRNNLLIYLLYLKHDLLLLPIDDRFKILDSLLQLQQEHLPFDIIQNIASIIISQDHITNNQIRELMRKKFHINIMTILSGLEIKDDSSGEELKFLLLDTCTTFSDLTIVKDPRFLQNWYNAVESLLPKRHRCLWSLYTKLSSFNLFNDKVSEQFLSILSKCFKNVELRTGFIKQAIQKFEKSNFNLNNMRIMYLMAEYEPQHIPKLFQSNEKDYIFIFELFCRLQYKGGELRIVINNLSVFEIMEILNPLLDLDHYDYVHKILLLKSDHFVDCDLTKYFDFAFSLITSTCEDDCDREFISDEPEIKFIHLLFVNCLKFLRIKFCKNAFNNFVKSLEYFTKKFTLPLSPPLYLPYQFTERFDFKYSFDKIVFSSLYPQSGIGKLISNHYKEVLFLNGIERMPYEFSMLNEGDYRNICSNFNSRQQRLFYNAHKDQLSLEFFNNTIVNPATECLKIDYTSHQTILSSIFMINDYMPKEQRVLLFKNNVHQLNVLYAVLNSFCNMSGEGEELHYYIEHLKTNQVSDYGVWYLVFKCVFHSEYFSLKNPVQSPLSAEVFDSLNEAKMPIYSKEITVDCREILFLKIVQMEVWKFNLVRNLIRSLELEGEFGILL